jgi:hypothetical protein
LRENQGWLSPLGAGIKGMVQSKSPFLGSAILEGVGSGLEAYTPAQQAMALTGLTQAQTKGVQAETQRKAVQPTAAGTFIFYVDPATKQVRMMPAITYNRMKNPPSLAFGTEQEAREAAQSIATNVPAKAGEPAAGQPTTDTSVKRAEVPKGVAYDDQSRANADKEIESAAQATFGPVEQANIPAEVSKRYIGETQSAARAAHDNQQNITELAKNLASASKLTGLGVSGAGFEGRASAINIANTISRAFGGDSFIEGDKEAAIAAKIARLQGLMLSSGAGQESVAALKSLESAMANPSMPKEAYADLVGMLLTQNKRIIDRQTHANVYGQDSGNLYQYADNDFNRLNPVDRYNRDAHNISDFLIKNPEIFMELMSGKHRDRQEINAMFKELYPDSENMSVYFVGG